MNVNQIFRFFSIRFQLVACLHDSSTINDLEFQLTCEFHDYTTNTISFLLQLSWRSRRYISLCTQEKKIRNWAINLKSNFIFVSSFYLSLRLRCTDWWSTAETTASNVQTERVCIRITSTSAWNAIFFLY